MPQWNYVKRAGKKVQLTKASYKGMKFAPQFRVVFGNQAHLYAVTRQNAYRALMKTGALIRVIAQRSIRKRKGSSQPGRPPNTQRSASPLRKLIIFAIDGPPLGTFTNKGVAKTKATSVVIGPKPFKHVEYIRHPDRPKFILYWTKRNKQKGASRLEWGGIRVAERNPMFGGRRVVKLQYRKRPFMHPALRTALRYNSIMPFFKFRT